MAGVRLPVRTHPLHAFVTNDYAQGFRPIVASTELMCYVSQTERGQMLIGAEFDCAAVVLAAVVVRGAALRTRTRSRGCCRSCATCASCARGPASATSRPTSARSWAPPASTGFFVTTGWGTWGFKAIPAGGEAMAELIATGRPPALIAPFALDRFRRDHVLADQGSAGTR